MIKIILIVIVCILVVFSIIAYAVKQSMKSGNNIGGKVHDDIENFVDEMFENAKWLQDNAMEDKEEFGCPHGRASWRHCPHCLELNK